MINEYNARKFCRDDISKIENYDKAIADNTQTWHLHHRLELTLDGEVALSRKDLIRQSMYYNRPYYELIFLTKSEHMRIHHKGKKFTEEHCRKISEAGKGRRLSEETKRRLRLIRKFRNDKGISKKYSYMDSKDIKAIAMELVSKGINKITCEMKECKALTRRKISIKMVNKELLKIINDEQFKGFEI